MSAIQSSGGATLSVAIMQLTFPILCSGSGRSLAPLAAKRHLLLAVTAAARRRREDRIASVHVQAGIFISVVWATAGRAGRQRKHSETVNRRECRCSAGIRAQDEE